ncbi:helix-turn-helix domain-containing protein [Streptomyces gobiensis]|uniref:helix-turn-helix domain-containing protein n=1 Tax=Streptomyces gobiensis TaxID=2875706 RepID=UPI001E558846|nr:XRE family transcriptional regulator [Streptomyces gobiensis]UGY93225.1 XRE family transcriptional regulator [Streptomyces gobiensis]
MPEKLVECERLAEAMRELRADSGLSLAALAERTSYSKSSWERYLNGKKLPSRQAVEELVRVCRAEREAVRRLGALWELADAAWSGRGGWASPPPQPQPSGATEPSASAASAASGQSGQSGQSGESARRGGWRVAVRGRRGAVTTVLAGTGALTAVGAAFAFGFLGSASGDASPSPSPALTTGCRGAECTGKDPEQNACGAAHADPVTVAEYRSASGARLEIRYSTVCSAGWGRIWNADIGDRVLVTSSADKNGASQVARVDDEYDADGYVYTRMTWASDRSELRACLLPKDGGERECFPP